ncbi:MULTISPECIES: glutathione S-transferase family protein [Stenotrophomonas]|jgi:glutathione S-transferase|uniref:glutathione S-transferase family protein n=1 Tax=Stenotrophomonas TaxID=40323 RepID=UPI000702DD7F|nr:MULTISPECIES: glutathione S-transferase [Stenotrophomonas]KRG85725.1 glutathione S-transferase [Stenotrophomonas acidaminiphila]QOF98864.1 glutathione S-transferase [Stenotrophomonas sp. CW117]
MLKIWGRRNSSNVRKVLWCAEEIGLPYESIEVGGAFGGTQTPEYRQMNPNGLVPVIEDHGLPVWESNAIVRYLSARYALGTLYPEDPALRAQSEKWMDWTISSFAVAFRDLFWGVVRTAPADRDAARIDAALVRCGELLALADAELARQSWLSGDTFAMGDIPLGAFAYAWFEMPVQRPELPHLAGWYARLQQRPAYRSAVMTPLT